MRIKGFTGTTLIDYPGKVASIVFTEGCSFRCPFCHNPELTKVSEQGSLCADKILDKLSSRRGFIDGVQISGGEPLLNSGLPDFIKSVKSMGLAVKLDTNGYHPELLKKLLDSGNLDYVAMDIKSSSSKYAKAAGVSVDFSRIKESVSKIMESELSYEFRTTAVPGIVASDDIVEIGEMIEGANGYYIQQFVPEKTLNPEFSDLAPYKISVLEEMKMLAEQYVSQVYIRTA